jgi:hypothetical protein
VYEHARLWCRDSTNICIIYTYVCVCVCGGQPPKGNSLISLPLSLSLSLSLSLCATHTHTHIHLALLPCPSYAPGLCCHSDTGQPLWHQGSMHSCGWCLFVCLFGIQYGVRGWGGCCSSVLCVVCCVCSLSSLPLCLSLSSLSPSLHPPSLHTTLTHHTHIYVTTFPQEDNVPSDGCLQVQKRGGLGGHCCTSVM